MDLDGHNAMVPGTPVLTGAAYGPGATFWNGGYVVDSSPGGLATLTVNGEDTTLANPTTPGDDVAGSMDNFDPSQSYTWQFIHWTGTYSGPTDVATLNAATNFDTSGFANAAGGHFSWRLDTTDRTLSLVYTPPPVVASARSTKPVRASNF